MRTLEYLSDPALRAVLLPGVVTGLAIGVAGACLSVLVVLRRMSFVGQGISHAAFGGMGLAALLGLATTGADGAASAGQFVVVALFCLAGAMVIGRLSETRGTSADTAIGIVLVASMAAGVLLLSLAFRLRGGGGAQAWESVLFGSVLAVSRADAAVAVGVSAAAIGAAWWWRRPLVFWAFDEPAAPAFGVNGTLMKNLLLALLTLQIVASMKLAGVVLATALLVLPGAAALRMSRRLSRVISWSVGASTLGMLGGVVASIELDLPPGPCVVGVLTLLYAGARLAGGRAAAARPATVAP